MFRNFRFPISLLLLAAAVLIAGCGGKGAVSPQGVVAEAFDDLRAQVAQVVVDAERRDTAIELVDRLERDYGALYDGVQERRTRLRALHANYDATREQLVDLADQLEADVREARRTTGLTHRELMAATTAEEWASIRKANTKTMKAAIAALQSI